MVTDLRLSFCSFCIIQGNRVKGFNSNSCVMLSLEESRNIFAKFQLEIQKEVLRMSDWREFIRSNMMELVQSTLIGTELIVHLFSFGMVDEEERYLLMEVRRPHESRALRLYTQIVNKWNDDMYEEFLGALKLSVNIRALVILKSAARRNTNVHTAAAEERTDWNQLIKSNLQQLVESTRFQYGLVVGLYSNEMIDRAQQFFLMNDNISHEERATRLYTQIAQQWDDSKFPHLITALQASRNGRAYRIFVENLQISGLSQRKDQSETQAKKPILGGNYVVKHENDLQNTKSKSLNVEHDGSTQELLPVSPQNLQESENPVGSGAVVVSMANPGNSYVNFYPPSTNDYQIFYSPKFIFILLLVLALIVFHCLSQFFS